MIDARKTDDLAKSTGIQSLARFFNYSAGSLLLAIATTICIGNVISAGWVSPHEPVFGMSLRLFWWAFCGITAVVSLLCLFKHDKVYPTASAAVVATGYVLYWLALIHHGSLKPAVYLGTIPHVWGVSRNAAGLLFALIFGYLLMGSYSLVFCFWRLSRPKSPETG